MNDELEHVRSVRNNSVCPLASVDDVFVQRSILRMRVSARMKCFWMRPHNCLQNDTSRIKRADAKIGKYLFPHYAERQSQLRRHNSRSAGASGAKTFRQISGFCKIRWAARSEKENPRNSKVGDTRYAFCPRPQQAIKIHWNSIAIAHAGGCRALGGWEERQERRGIDFVAGRRRCLIGGGVPHFAIAVVIKELKTGSV